MTAELHGMLTDVRSIAAQRGWNRVERLADELASPQSSATLLLTGPGAGDSRLKEWVREAAPELPVEARSLAELEEDPLAAVRAQKVIGVFECGRRIDAEVLRAAVGLVLSRPVGTYAVVLTGAETMAGEEDRELVQRSAWRLLVPGPKPEWSQQDLLEHAVYLWSAAGPEGFLLRQLQRDQDALLAWLRGPVPERVAEELGRYQVLATIEAAEAAADAASEIPEPQEGREARRIFEAAEEIRALRSRLLSRLDADAASMERELLTSLQVLKQDLLKELPGYLHSIELARTTGPESGKLLREIVEGYIARHAAGWQTRASRVVSARERDTAGDTEALLRSIDWSLVNQVARLSGKTATYPEALLECLPRPAAGWTMESEAAGGSPHPSVEHPEFRQAASRPSALRFLAAGLLAPVFAAAIGIGAMGMAAAGVAALVGAGWLDRRERLAHNLRACLDYAETAIHHAIRFAERQVCEEVRQGVFALRQRLDAELASLQETLDRAFYETIRPPDGREQRDADREALAACRRRLSADASIAA